MSIESPLLKSILNSINDHIAVIDRTGNIVYVNNSWENYYIQNNGDPNTHWQGINYLDACRKALQRGDDSVKDVLKGIEAVIKGESAGFSWPYPCHSTTEKRWFLMTAKPLADSHEYCLINHQNVTTHKLAEEKASQHATVDELTQHATKLEFNRFIQEEFNRCSRSALPLSIAFLDIDYFKSVNDNYGHIVGDDYIVEVANILNNYVRRPSDICSRFGGDEFVLGWGDTSYQQAFQLASDLVRDVKQLGLPVKTTSDESVLTVTVGFATSVCTVGDSPSQIILQADNMLLQAKRNGRNCACGSPNLSGSVQDIYSPTL